jgi:dUTP pyrophosphatase
MSYRMIYELRRLMCDKFSVLCNLAELNEKQLREFDEQYDLSGEKWEDELMKLNVKIKRLNDEAVIPKYAREGDAGFDLVATEDVIIEPGITALVPTGLAFEIPPGYEMQIRPRSGVTVKTTLRVQLGTIDSGYRGEIKVMVDNIAQPKRFDSIRFLAIDGTRTEHILKGMKGQPDFTYLIRKGDRIAQAVIAPFETAHFVDVEKLEESMRGAGGFGSTGYDEIW